MGAFAIADARGDAAAELAAFSVFPKVDLAQLSSAQAKPLRGPSMSTARYLSVQTTYVAPRPPAEQLAAMRKWNPGSHSELKVYLHSDLPGSPSAANFSRLQNAPNNSAVQYLANATAKGSSDLQISSAEAKQLPTGAAGTMSGAVATFWSNVLAARARAFASGGTSALPPYEQSGQSVRAGEELSGLLRQQEKIRKQFLGLLDGTGIGRGAGSIKPEPYWELLAVDEKGVLTLGAFYSRAGSGGTIQTANALYYASGGYFAGLTLHQLWPVDVGGKPSTLVWRGDMISSASVASLRGIERMAAESTMIKDISRVVSLFRRDSGSGG
ncbi:MAG: hypothetical protein ABR589_03775 [Chthoniobacterales bacterium]